MKKILPLLAFCALVFAAPLKAAMIDYSADIQAMNALNAGGFAVLRHENGENGFHVLFEILGSSNAKEADRTRASELLEFFLMSNAVPKELLLQRNTGGQFPTQKANGILPEKVYEYLAQKFNQNLTGPVSPETQQFIDAVAPSLLFDIFKSYFASDDQKKNALTVLLNNFPGLLTAKVWGSSLPLYLYPIPSSCYYVMQHHLDANGHLFPGAKQKKQLFDAVNNPFYGLYAAFSDDAKYSAFLGKITEDADFENLFETNGASFADVVVTLGKDLADESYDGIKKRKTGRLREVLEHLPEFKKAMMGTLKSFGALEMAFEEQEQQERLRLLLSTPNNGQESSPQSELIFSQFSDETNRLKEIYKDVSNFARYFKTEYAKKFTADFWPWLYKNPWFNRIKEDSAARAFLIGWEMSLPEDTRELDRTFSSAVFSQPIMEKLIQEDVNFTHTPSLPSTALRAVQIMTEAVQYDERRQINSREADYKSLGEHTQGQVLSILGGHSSYGLRETRATPVEFKIMIDALRENLKNKGSFYGGIPQKTISVQDLKSSIQGHSGSERTDYQRIHEENMLICALAIWAELEGVDDDAEKIGKIAEGLDYASLSYIKERLYLLEDTFGAKGWFIKNRNVLDRDIPAKTHDGLYH